MAFLEEVRVDCSDWYLDHLDRGLAGAGPTQRREAFKQCS